MFGERNFKIEKILTKVEHIWFLQGYNLLQFSANRSKIVGQIGQMDKWTNSWINGQIPNINILFIIFNIFV